MATITKHFLLEGLTDLQHLLAKKQQKSPNKSHLPGDETSSWTFSFTFTKILDLVVGIRVESSSHPVSEVNSSTSGPTHKCNV